MPDVSLWTLVFLVIAAFAAGWIDAVVGGGGLLQLPAMLLGLPNASPAQILSTNKISSLFGTATSAVTFGVKVRPVFRIVHIDLERSGFPHRNTLPFPQM